MSARSRSRIPVQYPDAIPCAKIHEVVHKSAVTYALGVVWSPSPWLALSGGCERCRLGVWVFRIEITEQGSGGRIVGLVLSFDHFGGFSRKRGEVCVHGDHGSAKADVGTSAAISQRRWRGFTEVTKRIERGRGQSASDYYEYYRVHAGAVDILGDEMAQVLGVTHPKLAASASQRASCRGHGPFVCSGYGRSGSKKSLSLANCSGQMGRLKERKRQTSFR